MNIFDIQKFETVSPALLTAAIQVGVREATGRGRMAPIAGPYAPSLWLEDENGKAMLAVFTNHPLNRFALAIMDLAPFDRNRSVALFVRACLACNAINDRRFQGFIQDYDDGSNEIGVAEELVHAAARIKYEPNSPPSMQDLLRVARQLQAEDQAPKVEA